MSEASPSFLSGPDENYRYIKDPHDPERTIDMRHFLGFGVWGDYGEVLGWAYEMHQARSETSTHGLFTQEDLRSNYYGTVFFNEYFISQELLSTSFANFFADLNTGDIEYGGCWESLMFFGCHNPVFYERLAPQAPVSGK